MDLQSMGRGFQQTLLLLAFVYGADANVLLVDEPDTHLEMIRQRQIYKILCESSESAKRQVFIASHSEVLLNEAAQRGNIVSFVGGSPHKDKQPKEVLIALSDIGFEFYLLAEAKGWMLYLEGGTDLRILQEFACRMNHKVGQFLEDAPVKYMGNDITKNARKHFRSLKECNSNLRGVVLVDNSGKIDKDSQKMVELKWQKREIESYLCTRATFIAYAKDIAVGHGSGPLYGLEHYAVCMQNLIESEAIKIYLDQDKVPFTRNKASEKMESLFCKFSEKVGISPLRKGDFFQLVKYIPEDEISPEITEKLDAIYKIAESAKGRGGE